MQRAGAVYETPSTRPLYLPDPEVRPLTDRVFVNWGVDLVILVAGTGSAFGLRRCGVLGIHSCACFCYAEPATTLFAMQNL